MKLRVNSDPLAFASDELSILEANSLRRKIHSVGSAPGTQIVVDGKSLLHFASNNYLGLATDPRVIEASIEASRKWGTGAGSARLITGSTALHDELESRLAAFKQQEGALLFSSGYLANLGTIAALTDENDEIFSDQLNHASIVDGSRLSKASVRIYRHADADHLSELLAASCARRKLVVTDSVFSMDGDVAPLDQIASLCDELGAILMVDEAHATGVVGPRGCGLVASLGLEHRVHIVMGTLSKSLASSGGFIAGSSTLIELLRNKARSFIFDTAMPAPVAAAALCSLSILEREPELAERTRANATRLASGIDSAAPSAAIVPILVGEADRAQRLSRSLHDEGIMVPAIRPPSVPHGASRLRATVMATHSAEHIDSFIDAFNRVFVKE
ncbi:MAG: 8-amino-7-oxononanoate synthase [Actinomycetota bacterium]